MDAATSTVRPERDVAHSPRLHARGRAPTRWSIALALQFVVVGLPIAANYGESIRPLVEPSPEWAPRISALRLTGACVGAEAVVLAMRSMSWEGQRTRTVRR